MLPCRTPLDTLKEVEYVPPQRIIYYIIGSGVARGARGAMAPPKLLVNVYFLQLISGNLEVTRKCPKKFPELR